MRHYFILFGILLASIGVYAQQTVTIQAQSYHISDNLDLEAVAITFGESRNIEDFESRLNDPNNRISNLDLNNDGFVDFLRVVEIEENSTHLIVIQSVIGVDLYQDVASIIVEGENKNSVNVTIIGSRDIYGDNYVIVPRYVSRPIIFDWFWVPNYVVYHSRWYWNYYPHYYYHYHCLGHHSYHRHIYSWHSHHHNHCHFDRPKEYHHRPHYVDMHRGVKRNDYAKHYPYSKEPTTNNHLQHNPSVYINYQSEQRTDNNKRHSTNLSTSPNNKTNRTTTVQPIISTNRKDKTTIKTVPNRRETTTIKSNTSTNRRSQETIKSSTSTNRKTTVNAVNSTRNVTNVRSTTLKNSSTGIRSTSNKVSNVRR